MWRWEEEKGTTKKSPPYPDRRKKNREKVQNFPNLNPKRKNFSKTSKSCYPLLGTEPYLGSSLIDGNEVIIKILGDQTGQHLPSLH